MSEETEGAGFTANPSTEENLAAAPDGEAKPAGTAEVVIKPLSDNKLKAFFQKIGRWWLGIWYGFADKHPKLAPWVYKLFFFFAFSMAVTVWQFVIMTFLPYAFTALGTEPWGWPGTVLPAASGNGAQYLIFGDTNGLGYFIAFELAVFTAQCINFPLQRNITYKSHGNPWYQAMWYFIGWVLVSVFTNAIWGLCNCFMTSWGWYLPGNEGLATVAGLLKTVLTGGVSMVIFFFIFMVIFPDRQKQAKSAKKKLDALKAKNAPAESVALAEQRYNELEKLATIEKARKDAQIAESSANAKAVAWGAAKKKLEKLLAAGKQSEADAQRAVIEKRYEDAVDAARKRDEMQAKYENILAEYA